MSRVTSNLTYSNDLCCAFMTAVVKSYERQIGENHYLGRTAMQKLLYFAQALGVPVPCSYDVYTYGPYSDQVTFAVDSLLADDVLKDTSGRPKYSNYRLGENAGEMLRLYADQIHPHQEVIDRVVLILGRLEPAQLELVATLHFMHRRLSGFARRPAEKDAVFAEFRRVKKDKFREMRSRPVMMR